MATLHKIALVVALASCTTEKKSETQTAPTADAGSMDAGLESPDAGAPNGGGIMAMSQKASLAKELLGADAEGTESQQKNSTRWPRGSGRMDQR